MKKLILLSFISLVLMLTGCSESTNPDSDHIIIKDAVLYWNGDYAVDGCGFLLEMDSKFYKPENEDFIKDKYKQNYETSIRVKFKYLDKKINTYCFDSSSPFEYDGIELIEISDFAHNRLIGEWEWIESSGGIAGITLIPETQGYTKAYHFSSDSNLSIYKNDTLIIETTYEVIGDTLKIEGQDIYQIVDFKTDRIILYDQCIDCFINVFERKDTEPELLRVSGIWYTLNLKSDPLEIYDVSISGDIINLDIGYSGCVGHEFELFAPVFFMESNPLQTNISLYHKSSYDMCPQFSRETIAFSLLPLKEQYQEYYEDQGSVILNIFVLGDSTKFDQQPLYEF